MKGVKILLVDDDVDFCKSTTTILESDGYDVVTAFDGKEARRKFKKEKPDLVILDIMLPGEDGFSICSELKEMTGFFEIPILVLTSVSAEIEGEKYAERIALYHKADDYAEKPIDPKELLARVYTLITRAKINISEPTEKKKVLLIDSDIDFVRSMRQLLESNDFEVQVADTANGGIKMAKAMLPDLILMDAMLPDKDGFTVSRELKTDTQTYNIPIIMLSALDKQFRKPDFARTMANTHKVDEFIPKPIKPEHMLEIIQKYVQ